MFSVSSCSQDQQCVDTEPLIVQDTVPRSLFLDSLPTLDKSILYYHIAKNKEGEIDISHAVERVLSHKEKIDDIITSFGVPLDTAMALMLTESRGVLNAKSSAWAAGPWQIMPQTAKSYDKKSISTYGDKRLDLERSTMVAMKELRRNYDELEDRSLAFATYHLGIGNMRKLRAVYKETMGTELCSFDQLYQQMPSQQVIDMLANRNDDTFGYWIKIRNALTLLRLFEKDRLYFDYLQAQYTKLSYDSRGIVAEKLVLSEDDYLQTHTDVVRAVQAGLLQDLDHAWFVCGKYSFENFLHPDAQHVLGEISSLYGEKVFVSCGLLPNELIGDTPTIVNNNQILRLGSHPTGKSFDIQAPTNNYDNNRRRIIGWSDYNRLEMVLTLLRYQWKIVWCTETDPAKKTNLHFHITVLPSDKQ